jgi:hypothetical protein
MQPRPGQHNQPHRIAGPREFPPEHKAFKPHSSVHAGSVLRGAIRMTAAGWIIDRLQLRDPIHRSMAFAAVGIGIGYVEKVMRDRERNDRER